MANNRPPILGYLQSAIADNTGTSAADKLLWENEMNNQPQQGGQAQLMGEQGNPDNPQRWIRKNYNEDGSIASTSFVGEPQQKNKAQAHRNLLMEALSQPPRFTMGVPDKPWPMPEDMIPIGGTAKLIKHGTSKGKKILDFIASNLKNKSKRLSMEAKEHSKQIKNIGEDIKETQSWWTNKGKPSFKTAEEVRNQMKLVEQFPVQFMKKGVKGVQYPKQTQEYKVFMDRMRNTANNLEMKEKMKSFADYKFQESSLLKNRNDFLIKAMNDYKKTGMVRPSVEKAIREYSGGLERLPKSTPPSVEDVLKGIR